MSSGDWKYKKNQSAPQTQWSWFLLSQIISRGKNTPWRGFFREVCRLVEVARTCLNRKFTPRSCMGPHFRACKVRIEYKIVSQIRLNFQQAHPWFHLKWERLIVGWSQVKAVRWGRTLESLRGSGIVAADKFPTVLMKISGNSITWSCLSQIACVRGTCGDTFDRCYHSLSGWHIATVACGIPR